MRPDSLAEQAVISREQRLEQLSLTADDQAKELLGITHLTEGVMAALEESLQLAKSGQLRRLAHEAERARHERLTDEAAERLSNIPDEGDLPFAVAAPVDFAIGAAISGRIQLPHPATQRLHHGDIQIFRERVQFDCVGDRLQPGYWQEL